MNLNGTMADIASAIREKTGKEDKIAPVDFAKEIQGINVGVPINNQDKSVDITENGTTEVMADSGYTGLGKVTINTEVNSGGSTTPKWTGHADAEGLKAIGWTDEDIAYYQENGVNWNEEDDEVHKVTDDNKELYGVLTADNISTYKDRIVYLPKIDTSGKTSMYQMFSGCYSLTAIPQLNTSNVTDMGYMFYSCSSLITVPLLDTSNVTSMYQMFSSCYSLTSIPLLDTSKVTRAESMFSNCYSLTTVPLLDTSNAIKMGGIFLQCYSLTTVPTLNISNATDINSMFSRCFSLISVPTLNTSKVKNIYEMFNSCYSLTSIPLLDTSKVTSTSSMFSNCYSLTHIYLKNVKLTYDLSKVNLLTKDSLLYLINNEAATSAITIKLASYAYTRLATDPDIVETLANHPNISLAK